MKPAAPVTRIFTCPPSRAALEADPAQSTPNIDQFAFPKVRIAIDAVGHAEHQYFGFGKHLIQGYETRIGYVRIRAQHAGSL